MKPEPGYYWVRHYSRTQIAEWTGTYWQYAGHIGLFPLHLVEVMSARLLPPDEVAG